ncbi:SsgA family sporulation/cell division regulator [Streptomyces radiopugnans]|uniref:Streptomyces sporulation and cell division protein, SsgA n=1 Tax=Streptomyces radiopugnans TaxID=403935 RepID=A0A1H9JF79_9ACTN|nr:SsgA family sporulation/cell division regulator [Streptomyces radiopugnans]SEQ85215.1 Streptomyces sporulation and cell division protein, SsgA [Streptomyces radiopugnans]
MSVHKDEAMHTTTADDAEFAALMAASSLGAPHVHALGAAIPEEARRRLHAAAWETTCDSDADEDPAAPGNDSGTSQEQAPSEGTGSTPEADTLAEAAGSGRVPLPGLWRLLRADGHGLLPDQGVAAPGDCSLAARLLTARLNPPRPRGIAARLALDFLRTYTDSRAIEHLGKPHTADSGNTALVAAALWLVMSSRRTHGGRTAFHPVAEYPGLCPTAPAMGGGFTTAASQASTGSAPIADDPAIAVLANGCGHGPATAIAAGSALWPWPSAGIRPSVLGLSTAWRRLVAQPPAGQEIGTSASAVAEAGLPPGRAEKSGSSRLPSARLTDLLRVAPPLPCDHACPRLLRPGRAADAWEIDAAHRIMSELAQQACPDAAAGDLAYRKVNPIVEKLPRGHGRAAHPAFSPAHLLVAAELAVDLAPAHRRAIPAQPPPLPDMDAYAPRPSSALLVPTAAGRPPRGTGHRAAADGAVDTLPRTARLPQEPPPSSTDGGILLWSEQGGGGPEKHAQLWLRLHEEEDDRGKRLPVRLIYRAADRYAITAVFNAGTDEERTWLFARELLADGLHHSVGIGDVIVWPGPDEPHPADHRRRIFVRLRSAEGTALLSMAREDAIAFLDAGAPLAEQAATTAPADTLDEWENELTKIICPRSGE